MDVFLQRLGIQYPIFLAPLAGGPSTPELAAAVSNAGGLGAIGAAYSTPEQIMETLKKTRALTDLPVNVNLFAGGYEAEGYPDPAAMLEILAEVHEEFGLPAPSLPKPARNPFPEQLEVVLEAKPEVFSFTFGVPPAEAMRRLRESGILTMGTATTVEEGRMLEEAGVDAIVAQGAEAGGHRGTFAGPFEDAMVPTMDLTKALRAAVSVPVIASGGLMDGRDIVSALQAGASAALLGTAFLACPEAGTSAAYREALLTAGDGETVITRAYSGRPARGLRNRFIEILQGREDAILPFTMQNALTRAMRTASAKREDSGYLSLWAGTNVRRIRPLPAAELVATLVREMEMTRNAT